MHHYSASMLNDAALMHASVSSIFLGGRTKFSPYGDEQRIIKKAKQGKNANEISREFEDETGIKVSLTTIRDITKAHKLNGFRD